MKNTKLKTQSLVKIIILILIVAIVGAIWMFKNSANEPEQIEAPLTQNNSLPTLDSSSSSNQSNSDALNPDFALNAKEIDLVKLKSYGLPILIDFGADDCAPCKAMAPVLVKLNKELQGKVIVKFVDVWKNQNAAANFPVEVIPTQFFFDKDGNPYVPKDAEKMQMRMYSMRDTNEHVYTAHQGGMTEAQIREVLKEMGVN